jgi:hypothetical protein
MLLRAGVANIMAYSWFSHCKKYLAALEAEKRFARTTKACVPCPWSLTLPVNASRGAHFALSANACTEQVSLGSDACTEQVF